MRQGPVGRGRGSADGRPGTCTGSLRWLGVVAETYEQRGAVEKEL